MGTGPAAASPPPGGQPDIQARLTQWMNARNLPPQYKALLSRVAKLNDPDKLLATLERLQNDFGPPK